MAEDTKIILNSDDQSLGTIQIAPRVLEIIAGIAASEVKGVSKMYGTFANSVSELLGRSDYRRGVKIANDGSDLVIDVDVYVEYGVPVPKTASLIQQRIEQQIALMTNLKVAEVNVHVKGIVAAEQEQEVDPDDIFGEKESKEAGEDE